MEAILENRVRIFLMQSGAHAMLETFSALVFTTADGMEKVLQYSETKRWSGYLRYSWHSHSTIEAIMLQLRCWMG